MPTRVPPRLSAPLTVCVDGAERVGGLDRAALAPLVRATVDNWAADGPQAALTGPIARGDETTVTKHAPRSRSAHPI